MADLSGARRLSGAGRAVALGLGLATLVALVLLVLYPPHRWRALSEQMFGVPRGQSVAVERTRPPVVPPPGEQAVRPLTPDQAVVVNAAITPASTPLEAATPFAMPLSGPEALMRRSAIDCLTAAIYYEAASESDRGQRAVAQVVLNRVRHPAFPNSVCGVVYQGSERRTGCQFSFTCDGSLARRPSRAGWERARVIATGALAGVVEPTVGMATHYHTIWVVPYWASSLNKITTLDAHIFYRWKGFWGRRTAFRDRYVGEPLIAEPSADPLLLPGAVPTIAPEMTATPPVPPLSPILSDGASTLIERAGVLVPTERAPPGLEADRNRGTLTLDDRPDPPSSPDPAEPERE